MPKNLGTSGKSVVLGFLDSMKKGEIHKLKIKDGELILDYDVIDERTEQTITHRNSRFKASPHADLGMAIQSLKPFVVQRLGLTPLEDISAPRLTQDLLEACEHVAITAVTFSGEDELQGVQIAVEMLTPLGEQIPVVLPFLPFLSSLYPYLGEVASRCFAIQREAGFFVQGKTHDAILQGKMLIGNARQPKFEFGHIELFDWVGERESHFVDLKEAWDEMKAENERKKNNPAGQTP